MILVYFLASTFLGGAAAWALGKSNDKAPRYISLAVLLVNFVVAVGYWLGNPAGEPGAFMSDVRFAWVPEFGISFHLAMDGLSLAMIVLTFFLGVLSVLTSWNEITERVGFFHFNLMWILAGIVGVFLALDLFLFYFFWEMMLIPMYFLIGIWGHEKRIYAAVKFFIFTQAGGLLMLLSILGLAFAARAQTGTLSFDYFDLLGTSLAPRTGMLLMLGLFVGFAVKLPAFPLHPWLPDAHTQAPTAGSVILAGLLLKTGAYGLIRFAVPLFPEASLEFAPIALAIGGIGIIYGAVMAFCQDDLKRLVAYTSVSHLGFVLLGVYAWNQIALQGAVMQMICHGLSTGALFILVGDLKHRLHTRSLSEMGGLWETIPKFAAVGMFFAMASLGLPGLGNFVAEFLTLVGAFEANVFWTVIAAIGIVFATVYSLFIVQRAFHGSNVHKHALADLSLREAVIYGSFIVPLIGLGIYPQPVLDMVNPVLEGLTRVVTAAAQLPGGLS
ncbi:NADH-quinone oxidoreductase subunit M [bacterium]|nr:NADH-quinone oxidoreductase subunit M [bacterium]